MTEHTSAGGQGPTEEQLHKLRAFERFTMAHPRLMHVNDRLMNAIHSAASGSLVLVIGPTGVGKTTLRLKSEQVLTAEMMGMLRDDPGRLPFVSVEAIASLTGSFNWRDHFTRMLLGMNEPLTADKLNGQRLEERGASTDGLRRIHGRRDSSCSMPSSRRYVIGALPPCSWMKLSTWAELLRDASSRIN